MSDRYCDDCGGPLVEVDQPTPMTVWDCPRCAEDGPTESQVSNQQNQLPPARFLFTDKDDPGRAQR